MTRVRRLLTSVPAILLAASWCVLVGLVPRRNPRCPAGTVRIDGRYCIDIYEGSLEHLVTPRRAVPVSPFGPPPTGVRLRAVSRRFVFPQGYISQVQARAACALAGKRLCTEVEWVHACKGPTATTWPYGPAYIPGRCNDGREGPVRRLYGMGDVFHDAQMNDPRLNQLPQTLTRTGSHGRCRGRYGVFDMVGNLHEWIEARSGSHGVFRGGYYVDTHRNGPGCDYATRAHYPTYHDYSIGFRCCADPR